MSSGRMVRKSITSTEIPSFANSSAANKAVFMIFPKETNVTSVPSRLISATPIGIMYSPSGTIPLSPYIFSDSMNTTGSLSRIAAFNKPFASYGFEGVITFKPGTCAYIDSKLWLCVAANCPAVPFGPRKTIGTLYCPPLICNIFAAELMIWSAARIAKFQVMNSTIGRRPFIAAPTAIPENPNSAIGVSITRLAPNSSSIPFEAL